MIAEPVAAFDEPEYTIVIDRARVLRWAEVVAFAIDATERERVDALLELAEQIEDTIEAETARERAA